MGNPNHDEKGRFSVSESLANVKDAIAKAKTASTDALKAGTHEAHSAAWDAHNAAYKAAADISRAGTKSGFSSGNVVAAKQAVKDAVKARDNHAAVMEGLKKNKTPIKQWAEARKTSSAPVDSFLKTPTRRLTDVVAYTPDTKVPGRRRQSLG